MENHIVRILHISHVTHDVLRIVLDRPADYMFTPGQATEIAINKDKWREERRPFTFTCLPSDDYLEFQILIIPREMVPARDARVQWEVF